MRKNLFVFVLIAFCFSCKKEEATPVPPTKTELLTSSAWKCVAGSVTPAYDVLGNGTPISGEYWSKAPSCWKDDIWSFTTAGKFTHDEGPTKCNSSDPQIYSQGTWKFETAENVIRITDSTNGDSFLWGINELTANSLKIVEYYQEAGKTYTFQYSFSR